LHTCYFSISLRASGIDARLRTTSISPVREQPLHDHWLPPQLLQHKNSLLQIFLVPDPDLARSAARRTLFQPRGHVPCVTPTELWYSKISVGEREKELEEQWGRRERLRGRDTPLGSHGGKAITGYPAMWSTESSP
jgi:hypothetical protein